MSIYEAAHDFGVDTLKDFLEKPSMLASGVFQTSDVAGTPIDTRALPSEMLLRLKQSTKLNGVYMYRADIEINLRFNATRFQQGRYFLRVVFTGGASDSVSTTKLTKAHIGNLMLSTSANAYEFDLATCTGITFTIPYTSVANYCLTNYAAVSAHDFCKVFLIPYDPLTAGSGDTTCQWALWARFVNITTSGSVVLQSGSVTLREAKKGGIGPVSGVADKIKKTATVLGEVPMLSPFTHVVSWMADVVGRAATIWGFSKPPVTNPASAISRQAAPSFGNSDGSAVVHKLGLSNRNEVPLSTGRSRTTVDELSLEFLARQSAWIYTVPWADSATSGTVLKTIDVAVGPSVDTLSIAKGYTLTPLDYISTMFKAYRVSVKYRLKLPKTEFHSGRLIVAFQPYDGMATPASVTGIADTDNLQRVIWDVRETNELEVEVPFLLPLNFQKIGVAYAKLYILVANELIAPSTVPSTVNILIEKCAGSVLEFAMPIAPNSDGGYQQPHIYFQSGTVTLGKASSPPAIVAESFGEKITSLRSLIKRYSALTTLSSATATTSTYVMPFEPSIVLQSTGIAGPLIRNTTYSDTLSWLMPLFAFSTGGVRIFFTQGSWTGPYQVTMKVIDATPIDNVGANNDPITLPSSPVAFVATTVEGGVSVEVPQYTWYGARSISNIIPGPTSVFSSQPQATVGGSNVKLQISSSSAIASTTYPVTIYRAAADDFNLSCFNGTIPIISNTAS